MSCEAAGPVPTFVVDLDAEEEEPKQAAKEPQLPGRGQASAGNPASLAVVHACGLSRTKVAQS